MITTQSAISRLYPVVGKSNRKWDYRISFSQVVYISKQYIWRSPGIHNSYCSLSTCYPMLEGVLGTTFRKVGYGKSHRCTTHSKGPVVGNVVAQEQKIVVHRGELDRQEGRATRFHRNGTPKFAHCFCLHFTLEMPSVAFLSLKSTRGWASIDPQLHRSTVVAVHRVFFPSFPRLGVPR